MHIIAAKAVAFGEALQPEFKAYAEQIVKNAAALADALEKRGFKLVTGGTSNHLILADVYNSFGIDGKVAEEALDKIGLTLNKNAMRRRSAAAVPAQRYPPGYAGADHPRAERKAHGADCRLDEAGDRCPRRRNEARNSARRSQSLCPAIPAPQRPIV